MQEENAIEVRNLHIRYKCLHNMSIRRSLFKLRKNKADVFEAVKGISFDVKKGEIVGLVGKNGSGKSTTLRAIAGIFSPDEGTIENYTDSLALLSIGVGFQTRLTGRENIYEIVLTGSVDPQIHLDFYEITSQYMVTDIIYETKNQWEYEQLSEEDDFIIQKVADILKDEPEALRYAMEALTYAREK